MRPRAPTSRLDPSHPHYNPDPHAHPGLHIIALVEGVKGALAVIAASGLALLGPAPLQRWIHILIARFQLDPEHGALALFAEKISRGAVHWAAAAVMAYGILHVIEAWGLWRAGRGHPGSAVLRRPCTCRWTCTRSGAIPGWPAIAVLADQSCWSSGCSRSPAPLVVEARIDLRL